MRSELENALLALLALHPGATGYELHRVVKESTGHLLSASFSQIYPALRKLHEAGLVDYDLEPIKNRPGKKSYALTAEGQAALQEWLASPVDFTRGFNPFDLRFAFIPLMPKHIALHLLDAGIAELEAELSNPRGEGKDPLSYGFLDAGAVDMAKVDFVWQEAALRFHSSRQARLEWLQSFRAQLDARF